MLEIGSMFNVALPPPESQNNSSLLVLRWPAWAPYAIAVALIASLVVCLAILSAWQEKQRTRERATVATQNMARLLDQTISHNFDKVDVVLQSVADYHRDRMEQGRLDPARLNAHLARQESLAPEVLSLRIAGKDGIVRFGRDVPKTTLVDVSDRDYFVRARDDPAAGLVIAGPILARISKQWVIVLVRRINAPDGSFAGVVLASFSTEHFERILSSVALGPHGAATIRTTDLALVHRYPSTKNAVGSREVSQSLRDSILAHPDAGEYLAITAIDGIERSNAYRQLQHYPFYVIVGLATDDYLGGWKQNVLLLSGLAALAVLVTCLAAILVYRTTRQLAADVVERKRVEEELLSASTYARSLLEASLDPLVTISAMGKITDVNKATVQATGVEREVLVGSDFSEYFTEPDKARAGYQEVFARGLVTDYPLTLRHLSGKLTDVLYNASVYRNEQGEVTGVFAAARDITDLKEAETEIRELNRGLEQRVTERTTQLEAANQELEAFAYSVSHDLRAPLRAIDGFSRKVVAGYGDYLDDEGRRQLQVVRDNAQRMGQLIDDLLAFSRMGRREMALQPLEMDAMVRSVVEELRVSEPLRTVHFDCAPLPRALGDPAMLRQVWVNLLGNALKFTRQRPVAHIEIGGRLEGGEVQYWVKDDGAGFDMQYAGKLFGVFQRLHRQDEFEGTGVGLAIAQRIVQRHGGRIWGEGKPDAGAIFWFALPTPAADNIVSGDKTS